MKTKHQTIIDDPLFFKWVYKPDPSTDLYWKNYMDENPDETDFIMETKSNLKKLSHTYDKMGRQEKENLSFRILGNLELEDKKVRLFDAVKRFMRYAAIAVLFSCISGLVVYFQMRNVEVDTYEKYSVAPIQVEDPLLILSDNKSVELKKSNSSVVYSDEGKIVLNDEKVLVTLQDKNMKEVINQLVIPFGNRSKATLSDGSVVWLNAGSRLVYPSQFTGDTREVALYGEAFFEISHNAEKPFIVKTSALDIKVLGTQFNVSAYADNNIIQTVLEEGSVAIQKKGSTWFEKDLVLKPNQMNVYNIQTQESNTYAVEAKEYSLWRLGLLKFDEINLDLLLRKVERYYNIHISATKSDNAFRKVSGKLDLNQDVAEVLEYVGKVSGKKIVQINDKEYHMQ